MQCTHSVCKGTVNVKFLCSTSVVKSLVKGASGNCSHVIECSDVFSIVQYKCLLVMKSVT